MPPVSSQQAASVTPGPRDLPRADEGTPSRSLKRRAAAEAKRYLAFATYLIVVFGTLIAAANLVRRMRASVFEAAAIIDLPELGGSQKLQDAGIPTFTLTAFALDDR